MLEFIWTDRICFGLVEQTELSVWMTVEIFGFWKLCPRSKIGGILFLSCRSFCHSFLLSETLTLLITFEQWVLKLWYFKWVFFVTRPFHGILCDKNFPWVPLCFTMWLWPWSLTCFLKTLTLLITFEQWVLDLWYFTWVILVTRSFCGYRYYLSRDLDLGVWPISFFSNWHCSLLLNKKC